MKKKNWLWVALAAVLCVATLVVALNWTAIRVKTDPLGALGAGVDDLPHLPRPLSVNFLGAVEPGERAPLNCAGRLDLQAGEEGLRLYLADCTFGNSNGDATFSLYADPTVMAASIPDLVGDEGWYAVDLTKPLTEQADGETLARFHPETLEKAQQDFDALRDALSAVHSLGFGTERQTLRAFLKECRETTESWSGGWTLRFEQSDPEKVETLCRDLDLSPDLFGDALTAAFTLNKSGTLCAVSVESEGLSFGLDLGTDPTEELAPRLEIQKDTWSATLALALDEAEGVTAPSGQNVFDWLGQN